MEKTFIGVREVDNQTFRRFKAKAVEERLNLGYALTLAMSKWLDKEENKPNPQNLLKIKPITIGNKQVKISEEIDQILYGKENDSAR